MLRVSMLIVVATYGLVNVTDNLAVLGLAAIPSWFAVGLLYFVPLALILAEFSSDDEVGHGGIYGFMARGLSPTWAFIGTWSYFVSNLVYLQGVFTRLPIRASLALSGTDVFASRVWLLPFLGTLICLALTWLATRGVRVFSVGADWFGRATLALTGVLVAVALGTTLLGRPSATQITAAGLTPRFDLNYFATFSWLLFAVSGAEVAAPYVRDTENPRRNFPRAILLTTLLIGAAYTVASVAVVLLMPLETITKATGLYDVWLPWADRVGLPGPAVGRAANTLIALASVASYVVWLESPIRAMFSSVPPGTFPARLTQADRAGTLHFALWTQAGVTIVLILVPLLSIFAGLSGSESFITLINDMSSLSLVVPYAFLAIAYIGARRGGMNAPFKMARSTPLAIAIAGGVLVVSAAGYFGAGLSAIRLNPIDWLYVAIVYGGPVLLIGVGLALREWSMRVHGAAPATPSGGAPGG